MTCCRENNLADDQVVTARLSAALGFTEMAAEQGFTAAQSRCGFIYATGWRSVTQSWTNLRREVWGGVRQLKLERMVDSATSDCATTTSEVWNETPHMRWRGSKRPRRKGADAVQAGIPGKGVRELISHFTNARSAPPRHEVAHRFARYLNEQFIGARLQSYNRSLPCRISSCVTACGWTS